ncbi:MAG TPA: YceI family protein [Flavobacteriaceae bacterium]|jgi:polyisoprenoid-binding protein YceI
MKKSVILFIMLMLYVIVNSCKEDNTNTSSLLVKDEVVSDNPIIDTPKDAIPINLEASIIKWKGTMLFSFGEHYGTVNFKSGYILKSDDKLSGGSFVVDMNTIVNTDGDYSPDLVDHLKNEDFFDVPKYPEATIEFVSVESNDVDRYKIKADLTIKGIKKPIVLMDVEFIDNSSKLFDENASKMSVKFKIDRTDWNINYASKGISNVKDYAISDAIELEVDMEF